MDGRFKVLQSGKYKHHPNEVGGKDTCPIEEVNTKIKELLTQYNSILKDVIDLHCRFERIYPFEDGNGRIRMLIIFKQYLAHDIVPFIITDEVKMF